MSEQAPALSDATGADGALGAILCEEMAAAGGVIPFDRFMELALYAPGLGYYARPGRLRVGRGGDFITSVSVGKCFGMLLARHLAPVLESIGGRHAGDLMVAEAGQREGQLAADMVSEFATLLPGDIFERLTYVAVEPCGAKREPLRATLLERGIERALVIGGWAELSGARGVVVANEVLDALPVKRYQSRDGQWFELGIAEDGGRFVEKELYEDQVALDFGADAPPVEVGFVVERCPSLRPFFAEISASFEEVHGCFVDYGLERSADFLDPGRSEGTLRAYRDQKLVDDPLAAPGEVDLTTHVDFECACHAAEAAGLHAVALSDQHRFLVHAARGWLLEIEGRGAAPDAETAKLLRQFQSLSHPSAMGMAFNVLEVRS